MKILRKNPLVFSLRRRARNGLLGHTWVRVETDEHGDVSRTILTDPFPFDNHGPALTTHIEDVATVVVGAPFTVLRFLGYIRSFDPAGIEFVEEYLNPAAPLLRSAEIEWDAGLSRYRFGITKEAAACA